MSVCRIVLQLLDDLTCIILKPVDDDDDDDDDNDNNNNKLCG